MGLIKDVIYSILKIQEQILQKNLSRTIGIKNTSKRKKIYKYGCLLSLESLADEEKNKMEEELRLILKQCSYSPDKILAYVQNQGTNVYYIKNPNSLYSVKENEGFIYPQKGIKALYLSFITGQKLKSATDEMFVLSRGEVNKFYFIYHFYNWYAYKHGVSGMDSESINMLNKYLFASTEEDIKKLQLSEIYKLKDAIKQDKASIEFVFKLCRDLEGAKKAFDKLTDSGASV